MEIKKEIINLNELGIKANSSVLVEGDIVLPDTKPDMQEILMTDAKCAIESLDYKNGKLDVSGILHITVLYKPDKEQDSAELKPIEADFAFFDSLDAQNGENLKFNVSPLVEHIGFTLVNSRKMSVKVVVSLSAKGYRNRAIEPVSEVLGDGLECKAKRYNIYMPISHETSRFTISDILTVPESMPDIEEILKVDGLSRDLECKVMNGKVMVKGELSVTTLYSSADETKKIVSITHDVPFAEMVEADGVTEDCVSDAAMNVVKISSHARGDARGDTKIISIDADLELCVNSSTTQSHLFAEDCYSILGKVETRQEKAEILEYIASENTKATYLQSVKVPKNARLGEILSVSAKPIVKDVTADGENAVATGNLVSFLVYRDAESNDIKCAVTETDFEWKMRAHGDNLAVSVDMWTDDVKAQSVNASEAEMNIRLGVCAKALKRNEVNVICDCVVNENDDSKKMRPSITIYFVEHGDTLWSIAKRYGTTVDAIKKANNLENDMLLVGNKLLIPKAC